MTITSFEPAVAPVAQAVPAVWRHVPALDGLRAFAVVAVLLFHGGYLQGGFLGVDLFFALSGFLITSLLIRDAGSAGGVRLGSFWGRRFRRLLPAVLTLIVVVAVWSWLFGSLADLAGVEGDGPWAVFYVANWHFIGQSGGYWESFSEPSMFDHLWSLAIEEQFYFVWPVVVVAIWRWSSRPVRTLAVFSGVGIGLSFVAMVLLYDGVEPTRVYMGTDTRAASLLVGALAATEPARRVARRVALVLGRRLGVVLVLLAGFVAWSWVAVEGASSAMLYRGGLLAHSVACAVVISLVVAAERGWFVRGLGWRPVAWIGVLSYGLYLWHWPVYVVLGPERTGLDGVTLLGVRIAVSGALAYASYRLVEDPVRHRAGWARGRSGVVVLVAAIVGVVVLLGSVLPDPTGQVAAFDPSAITVAAAAAPPDVPSRRPAASTQSVSRPEDTDEVDTDEVDTDEVGTDEVVPAGSVHASSTLPSPPPTTVAAALPQVSSVVWAGDSVAYDIAPALHAALTAAGWVVDDLAAYPGFMLTTRDEEFDLVAHTVERARVSGAELAILQISNWDVGVDSPEYASTLQDLSTQLESVGTRLLVLSSPPTGDADFSAQLDRLFEVANGLALDDPSGNLAVIDARAVWGTPGVLDLDGDGTPERKRDLMHVCPSGVARFVAWFTDALDGRYDGLTPGDPAVWAAAPWVLDGRYDKPVGTCAPV